MLVMISIFIFHLLHCDICRNTTVRNVIRMARTNVVYAHVTVISMAHAVTVQKSWIYKIAESTSLWIISEYTCKKLNSV